MKKKPERTEKTKAQIFEAFWSIYGTKAISRITVSDITGAAGIHRSTFYLHFTDIYDLLSQAEDELLEECNSIPDAISKKLDDDKTMMELLLGFYSRHISKLNALLGSRGDPAFLGELKKRMIPRIFSLMSISEDDSEMGILMDYMITAMLTLLTYAYTNMPEEPMEATIGRIHSVLTIGIIPLIEAHTSNPELVRLISKRRTDVEAQLKSSLRPET